MISALRGLATPDQGDAASDRDDDVMDADASTEDTVDAGAQACPKVKAAPWRVLPWVFRDS